MPITIIGRPMSDEKIQSSLPPAEALECNYENYLAELTASAEENVCIEKPEHHYTDQSCELGIVARSEYKETQKGIVEVIRVDEERILERRAQNFREGEETKETKEENPAPPPPSLPHSHGEEAAVAGAAALHPVEEAAPEETAPPLTAGAYLCFCAFADYHYPHAPAAETARGMRLEERLPDAVYEPAREYPFHSESAIAIQGAAILFSDVPESLPAIFLNETAPDNFDFPVYSVFHLIRQETVERPAGAPAENESEVQPNEAKPDPFDRMTLRTTADCSSCLFVLPEGDVSDTHAAMPEKGIVLVLAAEGMVEPGTAVFVFYPGLPPHDYQRGNGRGESAVSGEKFSYHRVNPKSGSPSGQNHSGSHSGGRERQGQRNPS